jgi:hypothetical protein
LRASALPTALRCERRSSLTLPRLKGSLENRAKGGPAEGNKVLIKVQTASVNYVNWVLLRGKPFPINAHRADLSYLEQTLAGGVSIPARESPVMVPVRRQRVEHTADLLPPSSQPPADHLSSRFKILPVAVIGRESRNSIRRGYL